MTDNIILQIDSARAGMRDKYQVLTACKVEIESLQQRNEKLTAALTEYVRLDRLGLVGYDKHQEEVPDVRCEALAALQDKEPDDG
jgi:hypothetical protein